MKLRYYPDTDMLCIELMSGVSTESEEVAPHIVLDFDANNQIIGIEIKDASKFIDLSRFEISDLPIASLVMNDRIPANTVTS